MYEVAFRTAKKVVAIWEKKGRSVHSKIAGLFFLGTVVNDAWRGRCVNSEIAGLFFLGTL